MSKADFLEAKITNLWLFGSDLPHENPREFSHLLASFVHSFRQVKDTLVGLLVGGGYVIYPLIGASLLCLAVYHYFDKFNAPDAIRDAIEKGVCHHEFIQFACCAPKRTGQSTDGEMYFFTMEKLSHGIVLQIAHDEESVKTNTMNVAKTLVPRTGLYKIPILTADCKNSWSTMMVMDWLFSSGNFSKKSPRELGRTSNVLFDSCQDFAKRVFTLLALEKSYPSRKEMFHMWEKRYRGGSSGSNSKWYNNNNTNNNNNNNKQCRIN